MHTTHLLSLSFGSQSHMTSVILLSVFLALSPLVTHYLRLPPPPPSADIMYEWCVGQVL